MKQNFYILSIIFAMVILAINQTVNAQSSDNFLNYANNELGFSIEYPSNWKVEEQKPDTEGKVRSNETTVWFTTPNYDLLSLSGGYVTVSVDKVQILLDTDTLTLRNKTLDEYVKEDLDFLSDPSQGGRFGGEIIRQYEFTLGGNPAWKIEYKMIKEYNFLIFSIANGKEYRINYAETPVKVPQTLPLANKMVESFQLVSK